VVPELEKQAPRNTENIATPNTLLKLGPPVSRKGLQPAFLSRVYAPGAATRLMPSEVRLQLVGRTRELPMRRGCVYEPKLDGCRLPVGKDGDTVQVRVRGGGARHQGGRTSLWQELVLRRPGDGASRNWPASSVDTQ